MIRAIQLIHRSRNRTGPTLVIRGLPLHPGRWSPASSLYKDTFIQDWQIRYEGGSFRRTYTLIYFNILFDTFSEFPSSQPFLRLVTGAAACAQTQDDACRG